MSFSRKANRAAARAVGPLKNPTGTREDRMHLLDFNMGNLRDLHVKTPRDQVLVICDTRDSVARTVVGAVKEKSETAQHLMTCAMDRVIPTVFLAFPTELAADLTSFHNPRVSEMLEARAPAGRYVIVIAGGGTSLVDVNLEAP